MYELLTLDFLAGITVILLLCATSYVAGIGAAYGGTVVKGTLTFLTGSMSVLIAGAVTYFSSNIVELTLAVVAIVTALAVVHTLISRIASAITSLFGSKEETTLSFTEWDDEPSLASARNPLPLPEEPSNVCHMFHEGPWEDDLELELDEEDPTFCEVDTAVY